MVNKNNLAYNPNTGIIGFRKRVVGMYDKQTNKIIFDYFMITLNVVKKEDFTLYDVKEEDILDVVSKHMTIDEDKFKIWEMVNPL